MKRNSLQILAALKTVLWSFIGIGGGRKKGEDFQSNPLLFIAIGFLLLIIVIATLVVIAKSMVLTS
jgi:hypothetical protein